MPISRRFPPPWSLEEEGACFCVHHHNGQQLAYVYFEDEPGWSSAAKLLTLDQARRIRGQYRQATGASEQSLKMRTPDQYREFAAECYRFAAEAKNEEHQKILREMARAWSELAEEIEAKS
jgi:hypothetical protein